MTDVSRSSLLEHDAIEDRVRMHLKSPNQIAVVVEGRRDELVLKRGAPPGVTFFPAGTRSVVVRATISLRESGLDRVLGVIDADFEDPVTHASIVVYEGVDLEAMLIAEGLLEDLVEVLGDAKKIASHGGLQGVVLECQKIAEEIAGYRLCNRREGLGVNFDVDLTKSISQESLDFNSEKFIRMVIAQAEGCAENAADRLSGAPGRSGVFRGKDCLAILAIGLRRRYARWTHQEASVIRLERDLHLAGRLIIWDTEWGRRLQTMLKGANPRVAEGCQS